MKLFNYLFIILTTLLIVHESSGFNLFKKLNEKLPKTTSDCEKFIQPPKFAKCSKSSADCRACCHFDLERLNQRYGGEKRYYLSQSVLVPQSSECLCEFCKKYTEDFNNVPYF